MIAGVGIYRQGSDMLRDSHWITSKYVSTWHYIMRVGRSDPSSEFFIRAEICLIISLYYNPDLIPVFGQASKSCPGWYQTEPLALSSESVLSIDPS